MRWRGGDLVASVVLGSSEARGPTPGAGQRAVLRVGHSSTNGLRAGQAVELLGDGASGAGQPVESLLWCPYLGGQVV